MKDGRCPKCGGNEVYQGTQMPLRAGDGMLHLESTVREAKLLFLDAFACINCGYVEMYVADKHKPNLRALSQDTKTWHKVA